MNKEEGMGKVMDKKSFKKAESVVANVVNDWDPYCLLEQGCPEDDFVFEISMVVGQIDNIKSEETAAEVISQIFSKQFEPEYFSVKDCMDVGTRLYNHLKDAGIVG